LKHYVLLGILKKCEKWLIENEKFIQEGLIDFGWKVIENLLKE